MKSSKIKLRITALALATIVALTVIIWELAPSSKLRRASEHQQAQAQSPTKLDEDSLVAILSDQSVGRAPANELDSNVLLEPAPATIRFLFPNDEPSPATISSALWCENEPSAIQIVARDGRWSGALPGPLTRLTLPNSILEVGSIECNEGRADQSGRQYEVQLLAPSSRVILLETADGTAVPDSTKAWTIEAQPQDKTRRRFFDTASSTSGLFESPIRGRLRVPGQAKDRSIGIQLPTGETIGIRLFPGDPSVMRLRLPLPARELRMAFSGDVSALFPDPVPQRMGLRFRVRELEGYGFQRRPIASVKWDDVGKPIRTDANHFLVSAASTEQDRFLGAVWSHAASFSPDDKEMLIELNCDEIAASIRDSPDVDVVILPPHEYEGGHELRILAQFRHKDARALVGNWEALLLGAENYDGSIPGFVLARKFPTGGTLSFRLIGSELSEAVDAPLNSDSIIVDLSDASLLRASVPESPSGSSSPAFLSVRQDRFSEWMLLPPTSAKSLALLPSGRFQVRAVADSGDRYETEVELAPGRLLSLQFTTASLQPDYSVMRICPTRRGVPVPGDGSFWQSLEFEVNGTAIPKHANWPLRTVWGDDHIRDPVSGEPIERSFALPQSVKVIVSYEGLDGEHRALTVVDDSANSVVFVELD